MSNSFIHEFLLLTSIGDEKELSVRLEMGRFLYNAVLTEGFKRIKLLKQSTLYKLAFKKQKGIERNKDFKKSRNEYKFSDYDLQKFAIETKNSCFIKNHLGTHECQKIATRVYLTLNKYLLGKGGRPRFKKRNSFSSIESKSNATGIRWKNNKIHWKDLELDVYFDKKDKYKLQEYALSKKVKYCRIYKKSIKNKIKWFVQLILEGKPFIKKKNKPKKTGTIGVDIGPSTIAVVSEEEAFLSLFCEELKPYHLERKKLLKKSSRSLRINNPDNYDSKKAVKKGAKNWIKSNRYKKLVNKNYEIFRKLKILRKRSHNKLSNTIIQLGDHIKTEKLSFKAFQKMFGKSIGFRGPAMFLSQLKCKAENAGIKFDEISTFKTSLSQVCHNCNTKKKKPLSQRWHECDCNLQKVQRDLYSAFLARFVEDNHLNISHAKIAWPGAHPLLEQAMLRLNKIANGKTLIASFGLNKIQRQSDSLVKDRSSLNEPKNVVRSYSESFGKFSALAVRTP